ncbi:MAG: MATE family efflux transporter [Spirochaetes bacterium]|nr:MATE family efflux transporter [Spirochaetota bacterium]
MNQLIMSKEKSFLQNMFYLALPAIAQHAFMSLLYLVDVMMIGQLGDVSVAAVGIANQVSFILTLLYFGVTSGASVFTAQFWGKKDLDNIKVILVLSLFIIFISSIIVFLTVLFFPQWVMRIFTDDQLVVTAGMKYLKLIGFSYLAAGMTSGFASTLRSIEKVILPMVVNLVAIGLNTFLNYLLIFGKFGFPQMGIPGAALATVIARFLELFLLVSIGLIFYPELKFNFKILNKISKTFLVKIAKVVLPVTANEVLWVTGVAAYNAIYARISTESIAAVNIVASIEGFAFVIFLGLSSACSIMIGKKIGEAQDHLARVYAKRYIFIGIGGAVLMGLLLFFTGELMIKIYKVSELTKVYAKNIIMVISGVLWIKVTNMFLFGSILRSGGDTRYAFMIDVSTIWLVGIPIALVGAFVLKLPVYYVILMVMVDEIIKMSIALLRFRSGKWIHHVTEDVA